MRKQEKEKCLRFDSKCIFETHNGSVSAFPCEQTETQFCQATSKAQTFVWKLIILRSSGSSLALTAALKK